MKSALAPEGKATSPVSLSPRGKGDLIRLLLPSRERRPHTSPSPLEGNNDHTLAADARGRSEGGIRPVTIAFLENLPLSLAVGGAKLVHSRPFVRQLGLSAMIGVMGRREAADFFRKNANGLLFRGHSHKPEMISAEEKEIRFSPLTAGQIVELSGRRPCIVTCGALTSGFVILWEPGHDRLECRVFG